MKENGNRTKESDGVTEEKEGCVFKYLSKTPTTQTTTY